MIDHMINLVSSEVGTAVLDAITAAGLTKLQVAEESGIPYPTLNRKVAGKSEFSFSELLAVSEVLHVSPAVFTPKAFVPRPKVAA